MNKWGDVNFRLILTTLVVVAMAGVGLFYTATDVGDKYDRPRGSEFNETFQSFESNFDNITEESTGIRNRSLGTEASQEVSAGFDFGSAVSSLKLVWNFFEFLENLVNQVWQVIGLPVIYLYGFLAVVLITILFLFLKAVFGVEP